MGTTKKILRLSVWDPQRRLGFYSELSLKVPVVLRGDG